MFGIYEELLKLEEENKPLRPAIIGAGQMGRGLVSQTVKMKGIIPAVLADIQLDKAKKAFLNAGVAEDDIKVATTSGQAADYMKAGKYVITEDSLVAVETVIKPSVRLWGKSLQRKRISPF